MTKDAAHTTFWQTTDFMLLIILVGGFSLDYFYPRPISIEMFDLSRTLAGGLMFAIGLAVIIQAKREFKRHTQASAPGQPTTKIVKSGIFSLSRNPLYLGIVLAVPGFGIAINNSWFVLLDLPLLVAIHVLLILPEEKYLLGKFKDDYLSYMTKVRRWI